MDQRGVTVWFTGLSGAGKTTICQRVEHLLRERGIKVEVLDGDIVRENLTRGLGFSKEDRDENIRRIGFVSHLLTRNGVVVLVAAISPYREARDDVRARIGDFVEVYVNAPLEVCEARDVKGLYEKARAGQIKQFTADASHELRSPLSFIRTVAEVALRTPNIDTNSREALDEIVAETARAAALLEDMLTLARADAAQSDAALEPIEIAEVVDQACEAVRPLAAERHLGLFVTLDAQRNVQVLGDFSSLRRLLSILLDNALKYTPPPGNVHVSLSTADNKAILQVQDSGTGIAASDLPHIFDRFYRADPSRSQIEGCGLGLAIARWIANLHQAEISVVSTPNKGSTFLVVFPIYHPHAIQA